MLTAAPPWIFIYLPPSQKQPSFLTSLYSVDVTFATAKTGAISLCFFAWAPCRTVLCTTAFDQFTAGFWCDWQSAPHRKPGLADSIECPSPSFRAGYWLLGFFRCWPDPRLVSDSFHVLYQCSLGWWNMFHCFGLLAEQLSSLTDSKSLVLS